MFFKFYKFGLTIVDIKFRRIIEVIFVFNTAISLLIKVESIFNFLVFNWFGKMGHLKSPIERQLIKWIVGIIPKICLKSF